MHTLTVLFVLLCSGILQFSLSANRLRNFSSLKDRNNWTTALETCESEGGSLLSLYHEEDTNMIIHIISSSGDIDINLVWVGLKRNTSYIPVWSNGEKVIFNESTVDLKKGEQLCEAIENGTWKSFKCAEEKAFMCQNGNKYSLVETEKNWCQAMQHCRTHFRDLASINDTKQNEELKNKSHGKSFWIGLQHDDFEWADKSCSTYRAVNCDRDEDVSKDCSGISIQDQPPWKLFNCDIEHNVICFKGHVRIRLINEPKIWEEALDYCTTKHSRLLWIEHQEDQEAVEQWLKVFSDGSTEHLWIGLRQSSVFGFWIWSDRIVNYKNWKNGQQPEMPLSKQCGVINAKNYTWSDEECWRKLPFLCEEDIIYMHN